MNDEIREILNKYKNMEINELSPKQCNKILDYITNLQEENERLKIKCDFLVGKKLAEIDKNAKQIKIKAIEQEDYKSRVENAVEYINTHYLNANEPELLNILQNGSEDNERQNIGSFKQ